MDSIPQRLRERVRASDSHPCLRFFRNGTLETELTFSEFYQEVITVSQIFLKLNVSKGSRVVIFLPKSVFSVVAHFATIEIGALSVPLNPGFTKSEMDYLLNDSSPDLIIVAPEQRSFIDSVYDDATIYEISTAHPYQRYWKSSSNESTKHPDSFEADDPALIIYTSGTTGNPKGAVLSHRNLLSDTNNICTVWQLTSSDIICHALPLFHVHGLCFALQTPLLAGASINLLDSFEPAQVIKALCFKSSIGCTVFMAVPAMYSKLIEFLGPQRPDLSHLRLITSGSAPLPVTLFQKIVEVFGQQPVEREGMTETGMNFSNPLDGDRIPGSIGLPLPGLKTKIVDPNSFSEVRPGEIGELWLKSPSIASSYWQKPQETAATFHKGWFRTGDLCRVGQDGYFYLTDRIKHIIISGGENVSAKEVESTIDKMAGVSESVVVGVADEKWGEIVAAAVVVNSGSALLEDEVISFCKERLHPWKCPKKVLFVSDIPRNTMGKVLKEVVKTWF